MAECLVTKMGKAELEQLLQQRYGSKIEPVKETEKTKSKSKSMRGFYEQMMRAHNVVHRMKDGRMKIKEPDGTVRFEG